MFLFVCLVCVCVCVCEREGRGLVCCLFFVLFWREGNGEGERERRWTDRKGKKKNIIKI